MSFIYTLVALTIIFFIASWSQNRGADKVRKIEHPFFSRLWLFPKNEHTRWEAEFDSESRYCDGTIGLSAEDNYQITKVPEPTNEEIDFAKKYLSNLELLFPLVTSGVKQGWKEWFHEDLPINWESLFIIDGFTVPTTGNIKNRWSVTLFCERAGHYFSLVVENADSKLESIDG